MADIEWDDLVDRLVQSKNFKENIKKVLVKNSSALDKLSNNAERFSAAKRWVEKLPYQGSNSELVNCAEYVIDHRQEDSYYANRNAIVCFKEHDHFNLVRNLIEHYICQVYNATHPVAYEQECDDWLVNFTWETWETWEPDKTKGKFTERQYNAFYYMAEELEKIRVQIIESKKTKSSVQKSMKISQFEQDLILDMIDYYLNLPEKNWYTLGSRNNIEDVKYDLQYLHDVIENL